MLKKFLATGLILGTLIFGTKKINALEKNILDVKNHQSKSAWFLSTARIPREYSTTCQRRVEFWSLNLNQAPIAQSSLPNLNLIKSNLLILTNEPQQNSGQSQTEQPKNSDVDIGVEVYSFNYEEPQLMKESGTMLGFDFSAIYKNILLLGLDFRTAKGSVNYNGMLLDGTSYKMDSVPDWGMEARALGGADFSGFSVYSGIGGRLWEDNSSEDPKGYYRSSSYIYGPFGFQIQTGEKNKFFASVRAEYDYFFGGEQRSNLSKFGIHDMNNSNPIRTPQKNGYGLRGSLRLVGSNFKIEPFVRIWDIGMSEITDVEMYMYPNSKYNLKDPIILQFAEPPNSTTELGVKLGFSF